MRKLTLSVSGLLTAVIATPIYFATTNTGYTQQLEEITVVARKTTENLQEVPLAITAIGAEEIERLGLKDLNQISQQDTSVQFDEGFAPSDTRITIRGLSPTRGRPNAATLVDGIDVSSEAVSNAGGSLLINPRLVDVQQIEIVKGPQSALYGRSAFAGAIQYVTKDPSDVFEADLNVDYNSEEQKELKGSVSIPLTETLGMLVNGLAYDTRGSWKNEATGDYLGDSNGWGTSLTLKWEPTETIGAKWRTEYTNDNFGPAAQRLLNDLNKYVDLGNSGIFPDPDNQLLHINGVPQVNLAPNSSRCTLTGTGSLPLEGGGQSAGLPGPIQSTGCDEQWAWSGSNEWLEQRPNGNVSLANYFANTPQGTPLVTPVNPFGDANCTPGGIQCTGGYTGAVNFGQYDPNSVSSLNLWNKQLANLFYGEIPDASELGGPRISPDYRFVRDGESLANAPDYVGTDKEVFRTSLVVDWAPTDNLEFKSLSSYTNADVTTEQDIGKWYVDECSPDVASLDNLPNPLVQPGDPDYGTPAGSYGAYLDANGLDRRKYAPCTVPFADGINDLPASFIEDSDTGTKQFSQEVRMAWQITEMINFTTGLQWWQEKVDLTDVNNSFISNGAQCYWADPNPLAAPVGDQSYGVAGVPAFTGFDQNAVQTDPVRSQCGQTSVSAAFWAGEAYSGRLLRPGGTERKTDHASWYGSLDLDFTDRFTVRAEARYTKEKNEVIGGVMTPCYDGGVYFNGIVDINGTAPYDPDPNSPTYSGPDGDPNRQTTCSNGAGLAQFGGTVSGQPDATETGNGGQATGPSTVILCGQLGRCDNIAISQANYETFGWQPNFVEVYGAENSWWPWGFTGTPSNPQKLKRTDRYWAPKATVEYLFTDDIMGYFSWSRGIKPGGFSLLTSGAFGLDANLDGVFDEIEFDEERLDVWEIGTKTTLFDGRVRLNAAGFFQDFKDKQVTVQKVTGGTTGTEVVNISGSEVWGLELDSTWLATENLSFQLGYTFLKTEYTDYTIITQSANDIARIQLGNGKGCLDIAEVPGSTDTAKQFGCVASFNGNELERAPKHAVLLNATYTNNLFETGLDWYAEGNYRYQDSRYMEAFNIVEFKAYSLTDLRAGIQNDWLDIQFYINNVFDDDTIISGGPNPGIATGEFNFGFANPIPPTVNAGPKLPSDQYANMPNPRTAGIRGAFKFGG